MKFLENTQPLFEALARVTGDHCDHCPDSNEVWQYMGTTDTEHQFRHRNRPAGSKPINGEAAIDRVYLNLDVKTLKVARLSWQTYEPTPAPKPAPKRPKPPTPAQVESRLNRYYDNYDYMSFSDADPGL
jgi:hypothetical protein